MTIHESVFNKTSTLKHPNCKQTMHPPHSVSSRNSTPLPTLFPLTTTLKWVLQGSFAKETYQPLLSNIQIPPSPLILPEIDSIFSRRYT